MSKRNNMNPPNIPARATCERTFERLWYSVQENERTKVLDKFSAYAIFREGWKLAMYHKGNVRLGRIKKAK